MANQHHQGFFRYFIIIISPYNLLNMLANNVGNSLRIESNVFDVLSLAVDNYGLSEDFQFDLQVKATESFKNFLACDAELKIISKASSNKIYGVISGLACAKSDIYAVSFNSLLYHLKTKKHSRNFIRQTLPSIISTILNGYKWVNNYDYQLKLGKKYEPLDFIVQKNETDYDFLFRQLGRFGLIFAAFDQQIIITDDIRSFPGKAEISLGFAKDELRGEESALNFASKSRVLAETIILKDHNDAGPSLNLTVKSKTYSNTPCWGKTYSYGENYQTLVDGKILAQQKMESLDWQRQVLTVATDRYGLVPGQEVTISCFNDKKVYRLINIQAQIIGLDSPYSNVLTLIPEKIPYRCPFKEKPQQGYTRGIINSEADCDGKYWVKLKYDTEENRYAYALRLIQPAAGNNHGLHFSLQPGTEVVIGYINSDQNRPVIIGSVPGSSTSNQAKAVNASDYMLRAAKGSQLLMQDIRFYEQVTLAAPAYSSQLNLDSSSSSQVSLVSQDGAVNIFAAKNLEQTTQGGCIQYIGANHVLVAGRDDAVSAGQDIKLDIESFTKNSSEGEMKIAAKTGSVVIDSKKSLHFCAGNRINIKAENEAVLQSVNAKLVLSAGDSVSISGGNIIFSSGKANLSIDQDGLVVLCGVTLDTQSEYVLQETNRSTFGGIPTKNLPSKIPPEPQIISVGEVRFSDKKNILYIAKEWKGTPYAEAYTKYAGFNARKKLGGDCGGVTAAVYKEAGYCYGYANVAGFIKTFGNHKFRKIFIAEAIAGDLVTWISQDLSSSHVHHIAIIAELFPDKNNRTEANTKIWSTHSSGKKIFNNEGTIKGFSDAYRNKANSAFVVSYWHFIGYKEDIL